MMARLSYGRFWSFSKQQMTNEGPEKKKRKRSDLGGGEGGFGDGNGRLVSIR